MNVKNIFSITAIVSLLFGLAFLIIPTQMATSYGNEANTASIVTSRFWAASLIGVAVILWMARNSGDSQARQAIITGGLVLVVLDLIVAVWAVLTGGVNALGWSTVVITLLLTLGFGYLQFMKPSEE